MLARILAEAFAAMLCIVNPEASLAQDLSAQTQPAMATETTSSIETTVNGQTQPDSPHTMYPLEPTPVKPVRFFQEFKIGGGFRSGSGNSEPIMTIAWMDVKSGFIKGTLTIGRYGAGLGATAHLVGPKWIFLGVEWTRDWKKLANESDQRASALVLLLFP